MEEFLDKAFERWHPTGSNYTCNPPVTDTDIDYICLHYDRSEFLPYLVDRDWIWTNNSGGHYEDIPEFLTFRKRNYNLIVTDDEDFYYRFKSATEMCKVRNLLEKSDRIRLFRSILYGEKYCD